MASGLVDPSFVTDAFEPLVEPEYGADMEAAAVAQAAVVLIEPSEDGELPEIPTGAILAVVGLEPQTARDMLGISRHSN